MEAEDARARLADRHLRHRTEELLLRRRDQRREVGGHAGLEQRLARATIGRRVGVEKVDAAEAVHLEIDEAGHGDPAPSRRGEPDRDHAPVADLDVPPDEEPVDERGFDTELHRASIEVVHALVNTSLGKRACARRSWSIPSVPRWRRSGWQA